MLISDMMEPDGGRVFMKSEFAPISDDWPCFSFSKQSLGKRLQSDFRPERDIIVYVGTTNPTLTENPAHRSRILSALSIEPKHMLETRKIVPDDVWKETVEIYGNNPWPYSLAVLDAALTIGPPFPEARVLAPRAYASFAATENRGNVVEAMGDERSALLALPVRRISLTLTAPVLHYMELMGAISGKVEKSVKEEAFRLAGLIQQRVKAGGSVSVKVNPIRSAPNFSELVALITRKWTKDQDGKCALCGGPLTATAHGMLQPSADRIDSANGAYDSTNVQVTHLACNWAKNQYGADDFADWLAVVRGAHALRD